MLSTTLATLSLLQYTEAHETPSTVAEFSGIINTILPSDKT